MSDSDDYFSDDIVLDDQTLAVLDAEESKFKRSLSSQLTVEDDPPPAKRQKTASGWQLGRNLKRTDTLDDMDDLPEISVRTDGTYDVQPSTANAISQTRASVDPAVSKQPVSTSNCVPVSRGSVPPPRGRGPFASGINYGAPPGNRSSESSRHASVARSSRPSPVSRGHSAQPPPPNADHANESPISAQLELLRRQMDEVRCFLRPGRLVYAYQYSMYIFSSFVTKI
ncbi:hypothetical protein BV22DRAFT_427678 [Leucogyrophana mollusca]|uniref:Uncharacterized protein n=1 Tax=Leucogyrophana mollusca TaxID=85980 RepID=A0ACB8BIJ5_9AGAM|nr:hypothetical protein BV22DRAFT_427678 [Leucogyrophana mollusca]